jgi:hypothetical protein
MEPNIFGAEAVKRLDRLGASRLILVNGKAQRHYAVCRRQASVAEWNILRSIEVGANVPIACLRSAILDQDQSSSSNQNILFSEM